MAHTGGLHATVTLEASPHHSHPQPPYPPSPTWPSECLVDKWRVRVASQLHHPHSSPPSPGPMHSPTPQNEEISEVEQESDGNSQQTAQTEPGNPSTPPIFRFLQMKHLLDGFKTPSPHIPDGDVIALRLQYAQRTLAYDILCTEAHLKEQQYRQTILSARAAQLHARNARRKAQEAGQELNHAREAAGTSCK